MSTDSQPLVTRPVNGFTPMGYRVVHFCLRGDVFNAAKAKATVQGKSLADHIAHLIDDDTVKFIAAMNQN